MDLQISGKLALVTGASKGIGLSVAQLLAAEGVRVLLSARNEQALVEAVADIRSQGLEAFWLAADVSREENILELHKRAAADYGDPDILIVNAGGPPGGEARSLTEEAWATGYDLTLMSAVRLTRAFLPAMLAKNWGRIVNITSVSVKQPVANLALSNAFRAAVTGYAKTLSAEIAAEGVTVNNVGPGYTATNRLAELFDEAALSDLAEGIPARRIGKPEEIAALAVFLSSQQAAYITGQTIVADGGAVKSLL